MPTPESVNPNPSGGCQPGASRLQAHCMAAYGLTNLGCYNPNSTMSGGGPSWHVHGEAIDLGCDWYNGEARARGDACFAYLLSIKEDLNLQQMIWGDRIYKIDAVTHYSGNDHKNHLHVALGHHAAATWTAPAPKPPPNPAHVGLDEFNEDDDAMSNPVSRIGYDGSIHSFWIDNDGELRHSWYTGDGHEQHENLSKNLGIGEIARERPSLAVTPRNDLLVGIFGVNDGIFNDYRWDKTAGHWTATTYP